LNVDIIDSRKTIIMAITDSGGIGPKMFQQMMMRLGAPEDFLSATYSDFEEIPRLSNEKIRKLLDSLDKVDLYEQKLREYSSLGIHIATYLDSDYPEILRKINDPPPVLYYKGIKEAISEKYIALVGTTKASQDGIRFAVDLARKFIDNGFGIISGLAVGIDSAAHLGALKENGKTIAVLGCGIQNIYPEENIPLAENIERNGLLISEHDPFKGVSRPNLVLRNRIISALSSAVVVVEIGEKTTGELKTAAYAIKQAKPLFYCNPDGRLDYGKIENLPGVIINDLDSADQISKYVI
jgi:DNA processing protein